MAKNDYFAVVYRILKYLYECFKEGEEADLEFISPEALRINNGYWVNIMRSISEEGYIKGAVIVQGSAGVKITKLRITEKGIDFLENNSNMARACEVLKTVKQVVPKF